MNQSVRFDSASKCMKCFHNPNWLSLNGQKGISTQQYSAVLEEINKKIPAEDESDTLYLDGEETKYIDQETGSETDVEYNPNHKEYSNSNTNTNVRFIHPFNL
ncbi:hypothetical protein AVEN_104687-1 [Araneus ventricosus]|uniref:Uncharacterized protein n=1 Tax=Araneus ventricosus TaxID=182803 RepID=A0A4Y2BC24_ARAVE|nr:hypothetical protein AVEN_104687-1 [Araneus ventricosus]